MKAIDRRSFVIKAGKTIPIIAGAPYLIACGDSPVDPGNGNGGSGSTSIVSVSSTDFGHSHTAQLPNDDLSSTMEKSYGSSTSGGHTHSVTFSAADFETLRNSGEVTLTSTENSGHTHRFTFRTA